MCVCVCVCDYVNIHTIHYVATYCIAEFNCEEFILVIVSIRKIVLNSLAPFSVEVPFGWAWAYNPQKGGAEYARV